MSKYITHTAIVDDCFRLILISNTICNDFHSIGYAHRESARLGVITPGPERLAVPLLVDLRSRWSARKPEEQLEQKLAFVMGWLCHYAANRQFASLSGTQDAAAEPTEESIYHDVFILNEVYAGGEYGPFNPALFKPQTHTAADKIDASSLEQLVRLLLQRALVGLHTIQPDEQHLDSWLDQLFTLRQDFTINLQRYTQIFSQPDPDKTRRYLTSVNFYDEDDPHIRVARAIQHRDELRASYVLQALQSTSASQYGQALKRGYDYLQAASDFFTDTIELQALLARLELDQSSNTQPTS